MASLNKVCLLGNVGKDPEIRSMNSGDRVANLSIATSENWTDKQSGEKKERTEWHRVVVWGALVGVIEKYVNKGSKLYVEGQLQTRKWTDNAGVEKYSTEIVLRGFDAKLIMLDGKKSEGGSSAPKQNEPGGYEPDEEIPF
jgi:single-strand DNA-binding protein